MNWSNLFLSFLSWHWQFLWPLSQLLHRKNTQCTFPQALTSVWNSKWKLRCAIFLSLRKDNCSECSVFVALKEIVREQEKGWQGTSLRQFCQHSSAKAFFHTEELAAFLSVKQYFFLFLIAASPKQGKCIVHWMQPMCVWHIKRGVYTQLVFGVKTA